MGRQFGNITRRQLLAAGLGPGAIEYRLRTGTLVTRSDGVYCQAPAREDAQARIAAAVLAGGSHAGASHRSAAWAWGFISRWDPPPEITLSEGDRRPRHILTPRSRTLSSPARTWLLGIHVTPGARTVLDIAPRLTGRQLIRLIHD